MLARDLYFRLAEAVLDQALPWLGDDGVIRDPVDGHDNRWQGGTAARFACPAALLARYHGRPDLVEPAARAMSQVLEGTVRLAIEGKPVVARGQFDLVMKELVLAWAALEPMVEPALRERWAACLRAFPQTAYDTEHLDRAGKRPNNYGVSAAAGEWLRLRHGLGGSLEWLEQRLADQAPLFTEQGLYRDPGDPMLYDLMVRQNLNELLAHGYDGVHRGRFEGILNLGDAAMLRMLSPCGYAPFGGRSNGLAHNEAMVVYCAERQAAGCRAAGRDLDAARFREAALRAARAVEPFLTDRPLRFIKNHFGPDTRHGRDTSYGEYANYALLAASLFARAGLVAEAETGALPGREGPGASGVLHLWPAFHKTFATADDTQVEIDTRAQPAYDATGLGRFHRAGAPPDLGLSMPISAQPRYILHGAEPGRAASHGPCWLTRGGTWQSLAGLSDEIETVECTVLGGPVLSWRLVWSLASRDSLPVVRLSQTFALAPGEVRVRVEIEGVVARVGWETPCLVSDGAATAETRLTPGSVTVSQAGWVFGASLPAALAGTLEETVRANRHALYRIARFECSAGPFEAILSLRRV